MVLRMTLVATTLLLAAGLITGCLMGAGPSSGTGGQAAISEQAIFDYLGEAEAARPGIVRDVTLHLRQGRVYRKRVQDQRNRWTLLTVWIDPDRPNTLNLVTKRNERCPDCNGTGNRNWKTERLANMPFNTRCLKCKGDGILENEVIERKKSLSSEDYTDPKTARRAARIAAYKDAPPGTEGYVRRLASQQPQERLAACIWLDRHYVRVGAFFQSYLPMLRKARFHETSEKKKKAVWQFWAGKGVPGEHNRSYYRIYVNTRNGKVIKKGFYPGD